MKRHIFLTRRSEEVARWREAFPKAEVVSFSEIGTLYVDRQDVALLWLHIAPSNLQQPLVKSANKSPAKRERRVNGNDSPADLTRLAVKVAAGCPVVVMSNLVNQEEGLTCLEAGASGYTNALSNPEVLKQIAMVVENGGLWVGPELVRRFRTSLAKMQPQQARAVESKLSALTPREREVALAVASGATNKEVARNMGITERTVKAHMTAIFDRLGVRDRMQLAILVNGSGA